MSICEDAPCCGCCGTSLYGSEVSAYDSEPDYDYDDYDVRDLDYDDDSDEGDLYGGEYEYIHAQYDD